MTIEFENWTKATEALPWGVQSVMYETLLLVADGKVKLAFRTDYQEGTPCLVNAVGAMTQAGAGEGIPGEYFPALVSAFDTINEALRIQGINDTPRIVSPLAAEILIRNFGKLKDKPLEKQVDEAVAPVIFETATSYREPTDEELTRDWLNALNVDGPKCEPANERTDTSVS